MSMRSLLRWGRAASRKMYLPTGFIVDAVEVFAHGQTCGSCKNRYGDGVAAPQPILQGRVYAVLAVVFQDILLPFESGHLQPFLSGTFVTD